MLCGADFDESDIGEATDVYDIPSVTGEWVKACVKLGRLVCPKIYHPIPNGLFTSVVAAISELGTNDRKRLYALITFHGGRVERNFTPKTTHLVCGIASGDAYTKAMELKSDKLCIVYPDWFYKCLSEQELIDPKPYHPRRLKAPIQNVKYDMRSLAEIIGTEDKTEAKQVEISAQQKTVREMMAKQAEAAAQSAAKSIINTTNNATSSVITLSTPTVAEENKPKSNETHQPTPSDNSQTAQRSAFINQPTQMDQSIRGKMVRFWINSSILCGNNK